MNYRYLNPGDCDQLIEPANFDYNEAISEGLQDLVSKDDRRCYSRAHEIIRNSITTFNDQDHDYDGYQSKFYDNPIHNGTKRRESKIVFEYIKQHVDEKTLQKGKTRVMLWETERGYKITILWLSDGIFSIVNDDDIYTGLIFRRLVNFKSDDDRNRFEKFMTNPLTERSFFLGMFFMLLYVIFLVLLAAFLSKNLH